MLLSFAFYLAALAVFVPVFGNHGLWAAMNVFLLLRGVLLALRLPAKADQAFRAAQ